jgi:hypothetical protein
MKKEKIEEKRRKKADLHKNKAGKKGEDMCEKRTGERE